jgi:hypothetical protein
MLSLNSMAVGLGFIGGPSNRSRPVFFFFSDRGLKNQVSVPFSC